MVSDSDEAAGTPRKKQPDDHRLVLNVGGVRHETHVSTLMNFQNTRLSRLAENHMSSRENNEYFFDRHPAVFNSVIDFYRSGMYKFF